MSGVCVGAAWQTMREHLRFSVCYWHTFRGMGLDIFGSPTAVRPWEDGSNTIDEAKRRADAAFELFTKLGVEYYTFHDVDVTPRAESLRDCNKNLDVMTEYLKQKQQQTGVKLLWGTANLFSHPRYMAGASTSPDFHAFARAGAQVKKVMEATHALDGQNFVFWGGREGFQSVLNTNIRRELDHMAAFLHMAVDHKKKIGAKFQLLIEPKPREPMRHQYDYDAQTVMGFLNHYGLQDHFKLNIEPNHTTLAGHAYEHDILISSLYGKLGSIDANTGDPVCGWDTDQFPMNLQETTKVMLYVLQQGGIAPGGLNFDCKVRRESTDLKDIFYGHIGAMDAFARGLRIARRIIEDGELSALVAERYKSWDEGLGATIESGKRVSFQDLQTFIEQNGEPNVKSAKQELFEVLFNDYF
jgi:xylose isomerase